MLASLLACQAFCQAQQPAQTQQPAPNPLDDSSAPLRRFPVSMLVKRPDEANEVVSALHVPALHPGDQIEVRVGDKLTKDWTFVEAILTAGQKPVVNSWNLWDKKWQKTPIEVPPIPDGDEVPLFFLVENKRKEHKIADGIRHALETDSEQIVTQTAAFESIYQQQNRLLNFMTAYAAIGPKTVPDPVCLKDRVYAINADLGNNYDPNYQYTQPGDLQHGLDAGVGALNALRESPDNPVPAAQVTQSQLPAVVSDWISLVGDLMHIFIRPPREVHLFLVPASATQIDPSVAPSANTASDTNWDLPDDAWMQLLTQRVPEAKGDVFPTLVYRPNFERTKTIVAPPLQFAQSEVLTGTSDIAIPLAAESRALFLKPWGWDWQMSDDGKNYSVIAGAHLVPGRGLVFPVSDDWWRGQNERKITIRAHVGFELQNPFQVTVARAYAQNWSPHAPDLAVGDPMIAVRLDRAGKDQAFYKFEYVSCTDAAGKIIPCVGASYDNGLVAKFDLASAAPGPASIKVLQEGSPAPDPAAVVFIAPKRPDVSITCGKGDKVLRISGPDAAMVKTVEVPEDKVQEVDDSEPGSRKMTLAAPLPAKDNIADVIYSDKSRSLEWKRPEPIVVGLPRPRVTAGLVGSLPATVPIGSGTDPSWAVASMPAGWLSTKQPVRIQLDAIAPFAWTHDVTLDVGLGSAGDVQKVATLPEGTTFAFDASNPAGILTLNLDTMLPPTSPRTSGLIWVRLTRSGLSSPWTIALAGSDALRAVRMPIVQSVDTVDGKTRVTFANADDLLGVKFAGQTAFATPSLAPSTPPAIVAYADGPSGATEFDLQLRDAGEGVVHVKLTPKKG